MSFPDLKAQGGLVGEVVWWMGWAVVQSVIFVPKRILVVVASNGGSVRKGWDGVVVWMDPKR